MSLKLFDPNTYPFGGSPERITLHWTGGSYTPSSLDAEHYQFLIDGDGKVWCGVYTIADQDDTYSNYAAHTKGFNTKNIGVSLCGMAGSQENGTFGDYPITPNQWAAAVELCAFLMDKYGIEVSKQTLASHCEIQTIHGVPQSGKWDVSAVQFKDETWGELNTAFREEVADAMPGSNAPPNTVPPFEAISLFLPEGSVVDVMIGNNPPIRVQ